MGSIECREMGVVGLNRGNVDGNAVGLLVNESEKRPVLGDELVELALLVDEMERLGLRLDAFFLFLDASGSLMKTHSRPREEHLEHGNWRLHLTFDSAQA